MLKGSDEHSFAYPSAQTMTDLFEEQVLRTPSAVAVVFEDRKLTYSELDELSNRLANHLVSMGAKRDMMIPLFVERSPEMLVGMLAIMKAGAAYVPILPDSPAERTAYILSDIVATMVLSSTESTAFLPETGLPVILLDNSESVLAECALTIPSVERLSTDLAYVIYTSGSTGLPKGVLVEHGGVVNLLSYLGEKYNMDSRDRILQFSNYNFDASVEQIFLALFNGGTVVQLDEATRLDPSALENLLIREKITHIDATPGFLETMNAGSYGGLKRIVSGGEYCRVSLAEKWKPYVAFYNEYGPTETSIVAIRYEYPANDVPHQDGVPIGRPVGNTRAYLLDEQLRLVPAGVTGELYIAGVQVTRGYLNLPEQTAASFMTDPFVSGERMYKTGDVCRLLPDGNLTYVGRNEKKKKIRGFRIELGEIIMRWNRVVWWRRELYSPDRMIMVINAW